ncbi:MAG: hypothetical protein Q9227_003806 [Pyrenula ochraceoflavens]
MGIDGSSPGLIFLGGICLVFLAKWVYQTYRSYYRLKAFKGPWSARFSNIWLIKANSSGHASQKYWDLVKKYGPITRVGPNHLITSDDELLRRMSAVRSPYVRTDWYSAFKFSADRENVFSETDDVKHTEMRKKLVSAYSVRENPEIESTMDRVIFDLISLLERRYLSTATKYKPFDFGRITNYFTLDVITGLAYSHPFGWLANDKDLYEYIKSVGTNMPIMNFLGLLPWFVKVMKQNWYQRIALPSLKDPTGVGAIKGAAVNVIAKRFEPESQLKGPRDMLANFISHGLTLQECADEGMLQILAGSDTTAGVIRYTLLHTLTHPSCYAKVLREIDDTAKKHEIGLNQIISDNIASTLPYLQATIKEALRLDPPISSLNTKKSPPEGDTLPDGTFIPGNVHISVSFWAPRRDPTMFGPDVSVFRPERWLEASEPQLRHMDKVSELVFGSGRFQCLGKDIAKVELGKVMFELFRRFEWSIVNSARPVEWTGHFALVFHRGFWMRVQKRELEAQMEV